ncbi:MAG TPA: substrate-binding domain-containing protein, partial [Bacteroidia bacterium]|nr:substrate-binding domain-containing protein [Bacteroidia bacterium]
MRRPIFPYVLPAVFFTAVLFASCRRGENGNANIKPVDTSVVMKGSESEFNLMEYMKNEFTKKNPRISVTLSGGGSAVGIGGLIRGENNIANASRKITDGEVALAMSNQVNPIPVIIATDAIAIITHPAVCVDSLSMQQLSDVFSGKITNWKEVGGADLPVKVIGRNQNSGTRYFLMDHLRMNGFAPGTTVEQDNPQ